MEVEPGEGWADAVSKILRTGTNNPDIGVLTKALLNENSDDSDEEPKQRIKPRCGTTRLKPDPQADALVENELKSDATRGVVHLFNAVKTVNPKSDKSKKKKKKKKKKKGKQRKGMTRKK